MARRGSLYRCHLFSFAGPQTEGVVSRWTKNLDEIGEREVLSGELVEMYVTVDGDHHQIAATDSIRFDLLEEDFVLTGGADDLIVSYLGSGAAPPEEPFTTREKLTRHLRLAPEETVPEAVSAFRAANPAGFSDHILVLEEPGSPAWYHLVAWWETERVEDFRNAEVTFVVDVAGRFEDQSEESLDVSAARVGVPETGVGAVAVPELIQRTHGAVTAPGATVGVRPVQPGTPPPEEPPAATAQHQRRRTRPYSNATSPSVSAAVEGAAPADESLPPWPVRHPADDLDRDKVVDGPSPFAGQLVAIFPRWEAVQLAGDRHVVAYDLRRSLVWGRLLFGAFAFAILEGPFGDDDPGYHVVRTNYRLTVPPGDPTDTFQIAGYPFSGIAATHWEMLHQDAEHNVYVLRALLTTDDHPLFPVNVGVAVEFYRELRTTAAGPPQDWTVLTERAKQAIFGRIDPAQTEAAARLLGELDAHAFGLLSAGEKASYLRVLIEAWTRESQEIAVIELFKSIRDRSELEAVVKALEAAGRYLQLFRDLTNSNLWSLLETIGERFGGPPRITLEDLKRFLIDSGLIKKAITFSVSGAAVFIGPDVLDELYNAAEALWGLVTGTFESIWMVVTEPEKVIEGIAQLVKLIIYVQLATAPVPYPPAVEFLNQILDDMARRVIHIFRAVRVLDDVAQQNLSEELVRKIQWALIVEVASWFIGVGEIRAAVGALRIGDRLGDMARVLRTLRKASRATDLARAGGKFERLAVLLARRGVLGREDDALRYLARLPADDVLDLERAMRGVDLDEVQDLAGLSGRHPELVRLAERAEGRAQVLAAMEAKTGGVLSDTAVAGFHRLATRSGFSDAELRALVDALPGEQVDLFMRIVRDLPEAAFGTRIGARGFPFFQGLSRHPRAMLFIRSHGYDTFSAIYRQANFNFDRFEASLDALAVIERRMVTTGQDFPRFLESLQRDSPLAQLAVQDARAARRLAGSLPLEETELIYLAVIADEAGTRARRLEELADRLKALGVQRDEIDRLRRRIRSRNETHRRRAGRALAPNLEAQRVADLDQPDLLLDEVETHMLSLRPGERRDRLERWLYELDLDDDAARGTAQALRAQVAGDASLRAIAELGGDPMLRRLWAMYNLYKKTRRRGGRPPIDFARYVDTILRRHYRGLYGEIDLGFRLSRTHIILKAPDGHVTIPGTDLVAIPRTGGWVWIIDNKAVANAEHLRRVNALTRNFPHNLGMDIDEFARIANAPDVPTHLRLALNRMRAAKQRIDPIVAKLRRDLAAKGLRGDALEKELLEQLGTEAIQKQITDILAEHQIRRVVTDVGGNIPELPDELERMGLDLEHL